MNVVDQCIVIPGMLFCAVLFAEISQAAFQSARSHFSWFMRTAILSVAFASISAAQSFTVASIRPRAEAVPFEHDGKTEITPGRLTMRDVTVATCIKWAYGVQNSQIAGPDWIDSSSRRFDIEARADAGATAAQMKEMMKTLLAERFGLKFHHESRELTSYFLTAPKGASKLHESSPDTQPYRENTDVSTIARALSMHEFADFISQPLHMPVVDDTGLRGRYDFTLNFTAYLPNDGSDILDNGNAIIISALQGELGLKLESKKQPVEVMVVDHIDEASAN
jgi:uncharacterized protein (TIGR03435 family)